MAIPESHSTIRIVSAFLFSVYVSSGNAVLAEDSPERVNRCALPAGWSDVQQADPRFVVFGELHGTNEVPHFVGELACALAQDGKRVLIAIEHNASDDAALQAAWNSDGFREEFGMLGFRGRSDGVASVAMFDMAVRLHALRQTGLPIAITAFNGFRDDQQAARFADLADQGPHEAAQAENIAIASAAGNYDYTLVLVGRVHAMKQPIKKNRQEYDPMARRLARYAKTLSLKMRHADGTSWNCTLAAKHDQAATRIGADDLDCGSRPTKGEAPLGPKPFIKLEQSDPPDGYSNFDGYFWVGPISASPPKLP